MTEYIYTRVSTDMQETQNQVHSLRARYPQAVVVEEVASGAKERPKLAELTDVTLQKGDVLIVAALDRLGRRAGQLLCLLDDLDKRGIAIVAMREGLDYTTIAGKVMAGVFATLAQMERNLISERTRNALAAKRDQGIRLGRPSSVTPEKRAAVLDAIGRGLTLRQAAELAGVTRDIAFRISSKERGAV